MGYKADTILGFVLRRRFMSEIISWAWFFRELPENRIFQFFLLFKLLMRTCIRILEMASSKKVTLKMAEWWAHVRDNCCNFFEKHGWWCINGLRRRYNFRFCLEAKVHERDYKLSMIFSRDTWNYEVFSVFGINNAGMRNCIRILEITSWKPVCWKMFMVWAHVWDICCNFWLNS